MSHSTAAAAQVEQRDEDDDNCMFFDEDDHNSNRNADDDAFDDLLNLSAHSSGAGSLCQRKDNTNDGDDDDATTTSSSSQCPDGDDDDGVIADDDEEVDDEAGCAATSEHDVNSSDAAVVRSLRKHNEKVQRLSSDAQLLMNRFHAFFQLHPQLPGLSKLRTRFEREVELATEAVTGQPMARGSHKQQQQQRPPPRNTTAPSVNRPSYIKCNCLPLLELTMHVLENEPNVVSVMHPVNPTLLQKVVQRGNVKAAAAASPAVVAPNAAAAAAATSGGGCRSGFLDQWQLPSVAFEVDIITCGGLRWIKIKGTSRRNLDLELAACADRRPFSSVLENIVRGATCCRQPFGIIPKVDVLIFYRPSLDVLQECGDLVENATSTARVAYAAANNSRNCRSMITKRAVAANGDDSSDDHDDVDVAPITSGHLLARRPKDECVDVTFRIFESSLKSYLVKHASSSSLSPSSPANCRDKVVEEEEESNNKKITWGALPLAHRFQLSPLFWSRYFLPPLELSIDFINFDVTALVALCSDTCNGFAGHPIPKHSILEEQSFSEAKDPSILDYIEHCLQKYTHDVIVVESSSSSGISTNKTATAEGSGYVDESSSEVSSVRDVMSKHISAVGGNASKLRVATVKGLGLNEEQREKLGFTMDDEVDENGFVVSSSSSSKLFFASQTLRALQQEASNEPSSSSSSAGAAAAGSGVVRRRHVRKNWIVSDVALSEFLWIVGTIAGPSEYRRAAHLLQYMFVVSSESLAAALLSRGGGAVAPVASSSPEHPSQLPQSLPPSPSSSPSSSVLRSMDAVFHLENTGKLADRHKAVFGLGNAVHAISISANKQFTQAARDQGIEVCVCHHPSRALTERKRLGGDRMDGPRRPPDLQRQLIETIEA